MKLNNILAYLNSIKSLKTNDEHVFIYKKKVSTYIFLETKFTSKMNVVLVLERCETKWDNTICNTLSYH